MICHSLTRADPILTPTDLTQIFATSEDWDELVWAWQGWREESGAKMPDMYEEFVDLLNEAAELNGKSNSSHLHVDSPSVDVPREGTIMAVLAFASIFYCNVNNSRPIITPEQCPYPTSHEMKIPPDNPRCPISDAMISPSPL